MAKFQFTTGKPESSEFFVEAGEYKLRVMDARLATSKTGNQMIELKIAVLKPDGETGVRLFDYLVLTDGGKFKLDQFLKSAGNHPGEGQQLNLETDEFIGWDVRAKLKVEEYNGSKSNKVVAYLFDDGESFE